MKRLLVLALLVALAGCGLGGPSPDPYQTGGSGGPQNTPPNPGNPP